MSGQCSFCGNDKLQGFNFCGICGKAYDQTPEPVANQQSGTGSAQAYAVSRKNFGARNHPRPAKLVGTSGALNVPSDLADLSSSDTLNARKQTIVPTNIPNTNSSAQRIPNLNVPTNIPNANSSAQRIPNLNGPTNIPNTNSSAQRIPNLNGPNANSSAQRIPNLNGPTNIPNANSSAQRIPNLNGPKNIPNANSSAQRIPNLNGPTNIPNANSSAQRIPNLNGPTNIPNTNSSAQRIPNLNGPTNIPNANSSAQRIPNLNGPTNTNSSAQRIPNLNGPTNTPNANSSAQRIPNLNGPTNTPNANSSAQRIPNLNGPTNTNSSAQRIPNLNGPTNTNSSAQRIPNLNGPTNIPNTNSSAQRIPNLNGPTNTNSSAQRIPNLNGPTNIPNTNSSAQRIPNLNSPTNIPNANSSAQRIPNLANTPAQPRPPLQPKPTKTPSPPSSTSNLPTDSYISSSPPSPSSQAFSTNPVLLSSSAPTPSVPTAAHPPKPTRLKATPPVPVGRSLKPTVGSAAPLKIAPFKATVASRPAIPARQPLATPPARPTPPTKVGPNNLPNNNFQNNVGATAISQSGPIGVGRTTTQGKPVRGPKPPPGPPPSQSGPLNSIEMSSPPPSRAFQSTGGFSTPEEDFKLLMEARARQPEVTLVPLQLVNSSASQTNPTEVKSGWLEKKGQLVPTVKRRWFSLRNTNLMYFKDQFDTTPVGSISLVGASVEPASAKGYGFKIFTLDREYYIVASSEPEMHSWMKAIRGQAVQANNTPSSGVSAPVLTNQPNITLKQSLVNIGAASSRTLQVTDDCWKCTQCANICSNAVSYCNGCGSKKKTNFGGSNANSEPEGPEWCCNGCGNLCTSLKFCTQCGKPKQFEATHTAPTTAQAILDPSQVRGAPPKPHGRQLRRSQSISALDPKKTELRASQLFGTNAEDDEDWIMHFTPQGKSYFYNERTGEERYF